MAESNCIVWNTLSDYIKIDLFFNNKPIRLCLISKEWYISLVNKSYYFKKSDSLEKFEQLNICASSVQYTRICRRVCRHVSVKSHSPYKLFQLVYLETVLGCKHFLFQSKWKKNVLIYYLFFKTRKLEYTREKK